MERGIKSNLRSIEESFFVDYLVELLPPHTHTHPVGHRDQKPPFLDAWVSPMRGKAQLSFKSGRPSSIISKVNILSIAAWYRYHSWWGSLGGKAWTATRQAHPSRFSSSSFIILLCFWALESPTKGQSGYREALEMSLQQTAASARAHSKIAARVTLGSCGEG